MVNEILKQPRQESFKEIKAFLYGNLDYAVDQIETKLKGEGYNIFSPSNGLLQIRDDIDAFLQDKSSSRDLVEKVCRSLGELHLNSDFENSEIKPEQWNNLKNIEMNIRYLKEYVHDLGPLLEKEGLNGISYLKDAEYRLTEAENACYRKAETLQQ